MEVHSTKYRYGLVFLATGLAYTGAFVWLIWSLAVGLSHQGRGNEIAATSVSMVFVYLVGVFALLSGWAAQRRTA